MIDFIDLLNKIARVVRPAHHDFVPFESLDQRFEESSLDSLDMLMVALYMAELYGVDDEICKEFYPETIQEMLDFVNQHKTKEPESIAAAMELIK